MYESHVTVDCDDEFFIEICKFNKIKPVIIEKDTGSYLLKQKMTAKFHNTSYEIAIQEMNEIASLFPIVIRKKLEKIISKNSVLDFDFKYKEFHSKFEVEDEDLFDYIVLNNNGHTSFNSIKGLNFKFFSTRDEIEHEKILKILKEKFKYLGTIREVVVYDDNESLDSNWNCLDCPLKKYIV